MKKWIRAATEQPAERFAIAIVDDKNSKILGFLANYRKGGVYHPGDIVQAYYKDEHCKVYESEDKAKRALGQYRNYSEVFIYDPSSNEYPQPSEKWKKKEVPTHLEVVELDDIIEGCSSLQQYQFEPGDWVQCCFGIYTGMQGSVLEKVPNNLVDNADPSRSYYKVEFDKPGYHDDYLIFSDQDLIKVN